MTNEKKIKLLEAKIEILLGVFTLSRSAYHVDRGLGQKAAEMFAKNEANEVREYLNKFEEKLNENSSDI